MIGRANGLGGRRALVRVLAKNIDRTMMLESKHETKRIKIEPWSTSSMAHRTFLYFGCAMELDVGIII